MSIRSRAAALVLAATSAASAQTTWTQVLPATAPSPRTAHGLAYHEGVQRTVLFGGCDNVTQCHNDTWLWDGAAWTSLGNGGPSRRYGHGMVYDSARDRLVLFGGGNVQNQLFGDTWEWDGASWTRRATTGPAPRWNHGMAYDPVRQRTVMFGGNNLVTSYGDTWEWDGTTWTLRTPVTSPAPRMGCAMAWDGNTSRVLLFGGFGFGVGSLISSDTWLWDGQSWLFLGFTHNFAARYAASMAWDEARERVVLFGGVTLFAGLQYSDDTADWNGSDWKLLFSSSVPRPRAWAPLAYDPERAKIAMFGGNNAQILADTHELAPVFPATFAAFGAGCPGSAGTPALAADGSGLPWMGETFGVELSGLPAGSPVFLAIGLSRTRWGPLSLPVALGALAPGCSVLASQEAILPLANPAGTASWSAPMPGVRGVSFYLQGMVVDPVNPLRLTFSNGGDATIGSRY
jgi:hypothetical protein